MEISAANSDEIARRGQELYAQVLRPQLETEANIGKIVVFDVESGDYELAENGLTAGRRLQKRRPTAAMYCLRIGYDAVYSFGGILTRTKA